MVLTLLNSIVGFMIANRTLNEIAVSFTFPEHVTKKICQYILLFLAISTYFMCPNPILLWLMIGIFQITLIVIPYILKNFLENTLKSAIIPLLDAIILEMQAGKPFKNAFRNSLEHQQGWAHSQFKEIFSALMGEKKDNVWKNLLLNEFFLEFSEIDSSVAKSTEHIKALRRHYKIQQDFRRRSGQVTQQIKLQSIAITFLYLGLLGFILKNFDLFENRKIILVSIILFLGGLISIFFLGKRMKWKV